MTMMSSGHILKSGQLGGHQIVLLGQPANELEPDSVARTQPVDDALLFTAEEVEDLCDKARASGAADAALELEPALTRIASALEDFVETGSHASVLFHRADADQIIDVALSVAQWAMGRELRDPQALLDLVAVALDTPLGSAQCQLRVHPDLVSVLYDLAPQNVEIVADRNLEIGEFRSDASGPDVAFKFDVAMERARNVLVEGDVS